ncbi:MAG: FAD-binding oxidoreductase [Kaiparowitsia implicata GSE-PSE-MK54-09C]|jgi:glycine/D-amino acid oxidase-like deaminating enzyme|nr:FAD-binding oxidoreductase [Kaiparowitsia implicata GSE-PSE-MK54-09C]
MEELTIVRVAIVGCGIVGAMLAYEFSLVPELTITVVDRQPPAQAATGAALGVLMGIISRKVKGRAWRLRQLSLQRYETLVPELEAMIGRSLPVNRQGIVRLQGQVDRANPQSAQQWQALATHRAEQGLSLELWDQAMLQQRCPQVALPETPSELAAVYSPGDRQLDPTALTLALVEAATGNGVTFCWGLQVTPLTATNSAGDIDALICQPVASDLAAAASRDRETIAADWVILAAGLGTTALTQPSAQPVEVRPVLGQAARVHLEQPLGHPAFQPVITGDDIHLVPLGQGDYWLGATVEFPDAVGAVAADAQAWVQVMQGAIALWPDLAQATVTQHWKGLRPRPFDRPAPVIEPLPGYRNVIVASGHYRNGVLLAPATADLVKGHIL